MTPSESAPRLPPIIFINLDEDQRRRAAIEASFGSVGLSLQRLPAIRWAHLPAKEQGRLYNPALNDKTFFIPLVDGEKGCYASHIAAWQWLLDSDAACAVVLEDDVIQLPGFAAVISAVAELPGDWDMVKLIGRDREKLAQHKQLVGAFELVRYRRIPSLAAGYVLSRRGANKLLNSRVPFARPVDVDMRLWWECSIQMRGVQPAVLALADTSTQSSIGARPKRPELRRQWAKFCFKVRYSALNAWHALFGRP
jgi:glycosyl transferase, family 25